MISSSILSEYQATQKTFKKNELIFEQQDFARYYYQIIEGSVALFNSSIQGEYLIQGIFKNGDSFGEPPILGDFLYPVTAITLENTKVWVLSKKIFLQIIQNHFEIHYAFTQLLAKRLQKKSLFLNDIAYECPKNILLKILHNFKSNLFPSDSNLRQIPLTRKTLSQIAGIRLETTIRCILTLAEEEKITIKKGKIYI